MIKVKNTVSTYPDDKKISTGEDIIVHSHWNYSDRVHIIIDGKEVIVIGKDMITAINNAMSTARF